MNLLSIFIVFVIILFSMVLHELAHGYVAYWLGDDTAKIEGRLTLDPRKHLDPFMSVILPLGLFILGGPVFGGAKPVPINTRNLKYREWGMAMVALAGPLTNFLLAFLGFLVGYWTGWLFDGGVLGVIFSEIVMINLGVGVFNLIPIPPLDGSRLIYAIAPDGVRTVMERMENIGVLVIYALILLFSSVFSRFLMGAIKGILQGFLFIVGA